MMVLTNKIDIKSSAVIIQARMSSNRFPGKMMSELAGVPLVEYVYKRCQLSPCQTVIVATSEDNSDDVLYDYCILHQVPVMRGDLYNVLRRSIQAAELLNAQYVVRVGGDTPLVDISQMGLFLERLINEGLDYVSFNKDTCASAFYFEVITIDALRKTAALTNAKEDLEHVTKFIIDNPDSFRLKTVDMDLNPQFIRKVRLTVDYPEDLRLVNDVVKQLPDKLRFSSYDVLKIMQQNGRYDYSGCTKG